jgi:hypothetical protein
MKNEDLLRCPLLQGLDAMHRAEMLGLINDSNLREKLESCMGRLKANEECCECKTAEPVQSGYSEAGPHWNPGPKLWPSGAKE